MNASGFHDVESVQDPLTVKEARLVLRGDNFESIVRERRLYIGGNDKQPVIAVNDVPFRIAGSIGSDLNLKANDAVATRGHVIQ